MNSEMFSHGNIWAFLWPQSAHLSGCHKSRQHVRGFIGVMNYGYGPGCALFIIYIFFLLQLSHKSYLRNGRVTELVRIRS